MTNQNESTMEEILENLNKSIEENNRVMEQYWADKALDESIRKLNEGTKASADEFRAYLNTLPKRDTESL